MSATIRYHDLTTRMTARFNQLKRMLDDGTDDMGNSLSYEDQNFILGQMSAIVHYGMVLRQHVV